MNTTNQPQMDPADRALIQSYVEKYVNTGKLPSEQDKEQMLALTKKYNIKINNNPRPILSRFVKIRRNMTTEDGSPIPYTRPQPKSLSKAATKKLNAKIRKQENRDRH
jgi:hypothetical protein